LKSFGLDIIIKDNYEDFHIHTDCYCCEDCDGDYDDYKKSKSKYVFGDVKPSLENSFKNQLSRFKTKDHLKNPLSVF